MKRTVLLITAIFVFSFALSAEITQEKADEIVLERMSEETRPHTVFANPEMQAEGKLITTSTGKQIELDYPCRVYFIQYTDTEQGFYLIVNANNGNLLQINAVNAAEPEDLAEWQEVKPKEIEWKLPGDLLWRHDTRNRTICTRANEGALRPYPELLVISSKKEFEDYVTTMFNQSCPSGGACVCRWDGLPNIDFTTNSVVAVYITDSGGTRIGAVNFQNSVLSVVACMFSAQVRSHWTIAIVTDKVPRDNKVELKINLATSLQQCEW